MFYICTDCLQGWKPTSPDTRAVDVLMGVDIGKGEPYAVAAWAGQISVCSKPSRTRGASGATSSGT
jgi:hypothetical protein